MINRIDCYQVLFELKKNGVDVEAQLKMLSTSPTVPSSVIKFINENRPMYIREFYETLRKKGNDKCSKLYKNIVKEKQEDALEAVKTLTSLLTHLMIEAQKIDQRDITSFYTQARASQISTAIQQYFTQGEIQKVFEEIKRIREDIKILESKGE